MAFFRWIRRLFGYVETPPRPLGRFADESLCPFCGAELRTRLAQQCLACGADWHNLENVRRPGNGPFAESKLLDTVRDRQDVQTVRATDFPRTPSGTAEREAAPLVFLGRGVSHGLSDCRSDFEELRRRRLPPLATPADLAEALGISVSRLRWLAFHNPAARRTHYISFEVPKRGGGRRLISAPHRDLAACQRWMLRNILNAVEAHEAAHGFVRGRNTRTNALPHVDRQVVVNMDLKDFFPCVTFPRVAGAFRGLGYSPAVATVLALIATESPRREVLLDGERLFVAVGPRALPQGAATSPGLSNLIARRLDARLQGLAGRLGFAYTRYADDLTFSARGQAAEKIGYLMRRVRQIVADEGFSVNESKTRVQRPHRSQRVTGVVVNRRPGAPRSLARRLRAILHQARHTGLEAQNRDGHPDFESWLEGSIAYVAMLNPRQAEPLKRDFRRLVERQ